MTVHSMLSVFMVLVIGSVVNAQNIADICIVVKDKETHETLPGVVVQNGTKQIFVTNTKGVFYIPDTVEKVQFEISCLGYKTKNISFNKNTIPKEIYLEPNMHELEEVSVVSAYAPTHKTTVAEVMAGSKLERVRGETLGKTLESIAGVNMLQTGATIVKPSINGMHGNRIAIVNNNVKLASQQWGDDHAPEIDPSMANQIEVIKGAEAVRYGANAIGGVVVLRDRDLPYGYGITGKTHLGYSSNGQGFFGGAELQSGFKNNEKWAWRLRTSGKNTGDLKTAEYYLNNTGSREKNYMGVIGFKTKKIGLEAKIQWFETTLGVFYGSHIGNLNDLKNRFEAGRPYKTYGFSRDITAPSQDVGHLTASVKGFVNRIAGGTLKWQYAYQNNDRKEFSVRRLDRTKIPALHMELKTHNFNSHWEKIWNDNWNAKIGGSFSRQTNYNHPGTGVVPIIPNFQSSEFGLFAIGHYAKNNWEIDGGARFDFKNLNADGYDIYGERYGGEHQFTNFTYSLGSVYNIADGLIKLHSNLGMAWRAPQVNELYSNGLHHGAGTFDVGTDNLESERGVKWINSINYYNGKLTASADFFVQYIKNYIYHRPSGQTYMLFSGVYPIFRYVQSDGLFHGLDANINYNFSWNCFYDVKASLLYADDTKTDSYFPFISPFNLQQEIKWQGRKIGVLEMPFVAVSHKFTSKQNRYSEQQELPLDKLELKNLKEPITPAAYHLFGISCGTSFHISPNTKMSVSINVDNLFNNLYKDYTNRFRYYAHDTGRNIQLRANLTF